MAYPPEIRINKNKVVLLKSEEPMAKQTETLCHHISESIYFVIYHN